MKSKALVTLLASAFLFMSFSSIAGPAPLKKDKIRKQIQSELVKVTSGLDQNITEDVRICFSIGESGDINIYKVLTQNPELQQHITNSLGDMTFDDVDAQPDEYYWVTIRYQVI
jgi:hypothetical protein